MKLEPFPERATSRYGEGVAFHLADALFTLAMPCVADRGDVSLVGMPYTTRRLRCSAGHGEYPHRVGKLHRCLPFFELVSN
jgi:hypothetical protein